MIVNLQGVRYRYRDASADAVKNVALHVDAGELVGIVGPNGSGKTTLVRLIVGSEAPHDGTVAILGKDVGRWGRKELAKTLGVVSQREEPVFPVRVQQQVMLGRYPHLGPFGATKMHDTEVVQDALAQCDVTHLADRWVATLSGGEWQRVRIARTLAQEPKALVLDEPTANLDIRHEMEVFELVHGLVKTQNMAGVVVTHNVNLAARFSDRILVMHEGLAVAQGAPAEVLTKETLEEVFGWPVEVVRWGGVPQFVPLRRNTPAT